MHDGAHPIGLVTSPTSPTGWPTPEGGQRLTPQPHSISQPRCRRRRPAPHRMRGGNSRVRLVVDPLGWPGGSSPVNFCDISVKRSFLKSWACAFHASRVSYVLVSGYEN